MEPLSPLQRGLGSLEDLLGEEVIYHLHLTKANFVIDPILGGRQHFIRRWRNASPVLGGPVRHSSMFYGGGYGGYGLGGLSMWQRLKMRLGFGRIHYGAGSTITGNSGLGVASTII